MKTLTLTLHDTDNCGSSLQAFALQTFLLSKNIENKIINYTPVYTINNGHPVRALAREILYGKDKHESRCKFVAFKNTYLNLTEERYASYDELCNNIPVADVYITGSDQLWNTMYSCGRDPVFYLSFVPASNCRKIAYAVSVGRKDIPPDNLQIIENRCQDFSWISLREKSSVPQIKNIVKNTPIEYVSDPVLLNDSQVYLDIVKNKCIDDKYILVYIAQDINRHDLNLILEKVKEERKDTRIVFIGSYRHKCKCDYHIRSYGPAEFLSLILNAEYIITNSFHATLFSVLFKRQFVTLIPPQNGERIINVLDAFGLSDRIAGISDCAISGLLSEQKLLDAYKKAQEFGRRSGELLIQHILAHDNGCSCTDIWKGKNLS